MLPLPRAPDSTCDACTEDGTFHQYVYKASSGRVCDSSGYWTPEEAVGKVPWIFFTNIFVATEYGYWMKQWFMFVCFCTWSREGLLKISKVLETLLVLLHADCPLLV